MNVGTSLLDLDDVNAALPALGGLLTAVKARLRRPVLACRHLTGGGKFDFALACVHHVEHAGLLCCYCAMTHIRGHNPEFELECDGGCGEVCFDKAIGSCGISLGGANYRLRRRGQLHRVRLQVVVGGFGICSDCAAEVDNRPGETRAWPA